MSFVLREFADQVRTCGKGQSLGCRLGDAEGGKAERGCRGRTEGCRRAALAIKIGAADGLSL